MTTDSEFIATSASEAATAHRDMIAGGYHSGSVIAEFERFFPAVAIAQAEFDAHYVRDMEAWDAAHPYTFDANDLTNVPPAFGPEHFSQWTKDAQVKLNYAIEDAHATIQEN